MCIRTGIRDVYQGVQGACPQQAVTHAEGTAECRAIGMGLRLVPTYTPISHSFSSVVISLPDTEAYVLPSSM